MPFKARSGVSFDMAHPEVGFDHLGVSRNVEGETLGEFGAMVENDHSIGEGKNEGELVLNHHHGLTLGFEDFQIFENFEGFPPDSFPPLARQEATPVAGPPELLKSRFFVGWRS